MKIHHLTKYIVGFVFYSALLFSGIDSACAHKVTLFAWTDGDQIFTQSKFSGGKKVKGQKIEVYNTKEKILLAGKTDDKGEFSFNIPERTTLKMVLYAGSGHRAEWTVTKEEIEEMSGKKPAKSILIKSKGKTSKNPTPSKTDENKADNKTQAPKHQQLTVDQIERAVERALDKKFKPVIKMINDSLDRGPTVGEILGGIGYIIGLMGIGAYFHYRRKKKSSGK